MAKRTLLLRLAQTVSVVVCAAPLVYALTRPKLSRCGEQLEVQFDGLAEGEYRFNISDGDYSNHCQIAVHRKSGLRFSCDDRQGVLVMEEVGAIYFPARAAPVNIDIQHDGTSSVARTFEPIVARGSNRCTTAYILVRLGAGQTLGESQ